MKALSDVLPSSVAREVGIPRLKYDKFVLRDARHYFYRTIYHMLRWDQSKIPTKVISNIGDTPTNAPKLVPAGGWYLGTTQGLSRKTRTREQ